MYLLWNVSKVIHKLKCNQINNKDKIKLSFIYALFFIFQIVYLYLVDVYKVGVSMSAELVGKGYYVLNIEYVFWGMLVAMVVSGYLLNYLLKVRSNAIADVLFLLPSIVFVTYFWSFLVWVFFAFLAKYYLGSYHSTFFTANLTEIKLVFFNFLCFVPPVVGLIFFNLSWFKRSRGEIDG